MHNSTIDRHGKAAKTGGYIGKGIKLIVAAALLLATSTVMAGIIFVPISSIYTAPELAPVTIQQAGNGTVTIITAGLPGDFNGDGIVLPPEYDVPASGQLVVPFTQDLELTVDLATGTVSGAAVMQLEVAAKAFLVTLDVTGRASCAPFNGLACGQLVFDLEARGFLTDPSDPAVVGRVHMQTLGSLVWDLFATGHWASMTTIARLEGAGSLIGTYFGGPTG